MLSNRTQSQVKASYLCSEGARVRFKVFIKLLFSAGIQSALGRSRSYTTQTRWRATRYSTTPFSSESQQRNWEVRACHPTPAPAVLLHRRPDLSLALQLLFANPTNSSNLSCPVGEPFPNEPVSSTSSRLGVKAPTIIAKQMARVCLPVQNFCPIWQAFRARNPGVLPVPFLMSMYRPLSHQTACFNVGGLFLHWRLLHATWAWSLPTMPSSLRSLQSNRLRLSALDGRCVVYLDGGSLVSIGGELTFHI